jgi:hypothetical protein
MTEHRPESELTRQLRLTQPIHCIEQVEGGYQARYLPPFVPDPIIYPLRQKSAEAVRDVPDVYTSASLDRDLFDAEVARRHDPVVIYQRAKPAIDAYQQAHPFVEDEEPKEE